MPLFNRILKSYCHSTIFASDAWAILEAISFSKQSSRARGLVEQRTENRDQPFVFVRVLCAFVCAFIRFIQSNRSPSSRGAISYPSAP